MFSNTFALPTPETAKTRRSVSFGLVARAKALADALPFGFDAVVDLGIMFIAECHMTPVSALPLCDRGQGHDARVRQGNLRSRLWQGNLE